MAAACPDFTISNLSRLVSINIGNVPQLILQVAKNATMNTAFGSTAHKSYTSKSSDSVTYKSRNKTFTQDYVCFCATLKVQLKNGMTCELV